MNEEIPKEVILAVLEKYHIPGGEFIFKKQCRELGFYTYKIKVSNLPELANALKKACEIYTGKERARNLWNDIRSLKDLKKQISAFEDAGRELHGRDEFKKAISYYEKAIKICEQSGDLKKASSLYRQIAEEYAFLNDKEAAEKALNNAFNISNKAKPKDYCGLALILAKRAFLERKMGSPEKEAEFLDEADKILENIQDENELNLARAEILLQRGNRAFRSDWEEAIKFYKESIKYFKKVGDIEGEAKACNNIGAAYSNLPGYETEAVKWYEKSISLRKNIRKYEAQLADTLANLALALISIGDNRSLKRAKDAIDEAIKIYQRKEMIRGLANAYRAEGELYSKKAEKTNIVQFWKSAKDSFEEAIDILPEGKDDYLLGETYLGYAEIYMKRAKTQKIEIDVDKKLRQYEENFSKLFNLAINFFEKQHAGKKVEECERKLGLCYLYVGKKYAELRWQSDANLRFEKALRFFRKIGDESLIKETEAKLRSLK